MKTKKFLALLLMAMLLIGTACSATAEATKQTVKVAVMCPQSGINARFYEIYKASIDSAVRAMAEDDYLKNYELEFEYIDDTGSTEGAPAAATYALDNYGCDVTIGHLLTTMILVSGPYFEEAEVPLLGIVSGPASISQGWEYVSIETGSDLMQSEALLKYLVEVRGIKSISLVNVNTEGGQSAGDHIEKVLKDYGLELTTRDEIETLEADLTAIVLKMKDAGSECVICWGVEVATSNLLNEQINQLWGETPEDVLFAGGTNMAQSTNTQAWTAENIKGVVFPCGYIFDGSEMHQCFVDYVVENDPQSMPPSDVGARVFDAVYHIATALNNMGVKDVNDEDFSKTLNSYLRTAAFTGVQGEFDFGAYDNGLGLLSLNVGEWGDNYEQVKIFP